MAIKFLVSGQEKVQSSEEIGKKKIATKKACQVCWLMGFGFLAGFLAVHFFSSQVGRLLTWSLNVKAVLFAFQSDTLVSSNKSSRQRAASLKSQRKLFQ